MESVTYNCYSAEDLAAQVKPILDAIHNQNTAMVKLAEKVAENDADAGVLEEIKALLGMSSNVEKSASDAPKTVEPSADTKTDDNTVTEPSSAPEPGTVTVQAGDTLQTLAEKTGATPQHLIDMNMLMEPVVLRPGQTLKY